jgi:positive regulator of sigma E activity
MEPTKREWTDEHTLLCEQCGYVIEGLDTESQCPECGTPIAESLRGDYPGSPWQHRFEFSGIVRSWYLILRRPLRQARALRVNQHESLAMTWLVNFLGAILITPATIIFLIAISIDSGFFANNVIMVLAYTLVAMGYWILASSYASLASPRVQLIARWRHQRLTLPAARTAVAYASIGLTLAPIIISASLVLISGLVVLDADTPIVAQVLSLVWLLSFPASVVYFEVLLWIACRRLRYRNRHERVSEQEPEQEPTQDQAGVRS